MKFELSTADFHSVDICCHEKLAFCTDLKNIGNVKRGCELNQPFQRDHFLSIVLQAHTKQITQQRVCSFENDANVVPCASFSHRFEGFCELFDSFRWPECCHTFSSAVTTLRVMTSLILLTQGLIANWLARLPRCYDHHLFYVSIHFVCVVPRKYTL